MPIRTLSGDIQYYPDVIENEVQLPRVYDGITKISANTINRLRDAILRIEEELGVNPSGTYDTVVARLDAIEAGVGGDLTELENRVEDLEGQVNLLLSDLGDFKGTYDTLEDRLGHIDDAIGEPILELLAGEDLGEGQLVRISADGKVRKADSSILNPNSFRIIGSVYSNTSENGLARIYSTVGTLIKVKFSTPPNSLYNGSPVYLSTNTGEGTVDVTTLSSGYSVFMIGILQGADGVTSVPKVVFQPSLVTVLD